jgi:hypothetical protein
MTAPRRWGSTALLAALVPLLPACGDGDASLDPQMRAPATGVYAYDALVYTAAGSPPDTFSGSLAIDVSSEDSITGSWSVAGYAGEARGIWNITAYTLPADPQPPVQGSITHRIWRDNASGDLSCNLTYTRTMPADTFSTSSENSCSLDRE